LSGIIKGCHGKAIRGETKTISIIVQRYIFSYALQCNAPKLAPSQVLPLFASPKQQPVQAAAWPGQWRNQYDPPDFLPFNKVLP
jgi:hypothetical protein